MWWLLLAVPLVVFYLFRPEPRRRSSTTYFLWKESSPESQGGTFARRLRSNPLMWLQLLLLLILALFLSRPATVWQSLLPEAKRLVLVVDRSASMQADGAFEQARRQALEAVEGLFGFQSLGRGTEVMLVVVDAEPQIVVPFTRDASLLVEALQQLQPSHTPDRLSTLRPFLSSLVSDQGATVWLFSDHLPEELEIPGLQFTSCAGVEPHSNVAVVAFGIETPQSSVTTRPFTYARLQNTSESAQQRMVVLEKMRADDPQSVEAVVFERSLHLAAGAGQTLNEPLPALRLSHHSPTLFRLRLSPVPGAQPDRFALDDVSYTVVPPFGENRVSVAVAGELKASFLVRALMASRNVELLRWETVSQQPEPPPIDLLVSTADFRVPEGLEVRSRMLVEETSPAPEVQVERLQAAGGDSSALVVDSGAEWPRLRVQVTNTTPLEKDEVALLTTDGGTPALSLRGVGTGRPTLVWRFPLSHSSLPLSPALPVVCGRFLDLYSRGTAVPVPGSVSTNERRLRPSGRTWSGPLLIGGEPAVAAGDSHLPRLSRTGFTELENSQGLSVPLAVNLFSPSESALPRTGEDRSFLEQSPAQAVTTGASTQYRESRTPWLLLALLVLLLETVLFLKRGRP